MSATDKHRCTIKRLPGGCGCEDGVAIEHGRYAFSGDPRGRDTSG